MDKALEYAGQIRDFEVLVKVREDVESMDND